MKRCLITGIGGFVGKYLSSFLQSKGFEIYGFDRSGSEISGVTMFKLDILEKDRVAALVQQIRPEVVIHLAAQSSVHRSWENPAHTKEVNVTGTQYLFDAIISAGLVKSCCILVVSSAEIYGIPQQLPITEQHPLHPTSPYGESRLEQEQLITTYREKYGLQIIVARSFPHTGPGQAAMFVCPAFASQIATIEAGKQEPVIKVGNLSAIRDFTDVRDVVRAYYLLLTTMGGGVFNVCSGNGVEISKVLEFLLQHSSTKVSVVADPQKMRPNDIPVLIGDNTLLREKTGWSPEISFEQTLQDILKYWRGQVS